MNRFAWAVVGIVATSACGGDEMEPGGKSAGQGGVHVDYGENGSDSRAGASDPDGETGSSNGEGQAFSLGGRFRIGVNHGHRNADWGDDLHSELSQAVGVNSSRAKLPETHMERWGWEIEVGDMQAYQSHGKSDLVAFLIGPTQEHSLAPAGTETWELDYWAPANLYEPIYISGEINPANYWAAYVYETVKTYKEYVSIWEVWNEPDWVPDWQTSEEWVERAPSAEDLPRFNADIFAYIRMLRVTTEAARMADPEAQIALGGIGYGSFLDAILRYTDNPDGGEETERFPLKGDAWFDVLNYHYYPHYQGKNSSGSARAFVEKRDAFEVILEKHGVPEKAYMATESGASHLKLAEVVSGPAYARNYVIKLMALAQGAGVIGVDWFSLSDSAQEGDSDDPYDYMGLYEDIAELEQTSEAVKTDTGVALASYGQLLGGAVLDSAAFAELKLPSDVDGAAFETKDGKAAWVLWAVAEGTSEEASASLELPVDASVVVHNWSYSKTQEIEELTPASGKVSLSLTGAPSIIIAK